ncbi:MAG: hypothetical protein ACFB50_12205 [Rubrobacteraceae bacterium]
MELDRPSYREEVEIVTPARFMLEPTGRVVRAVAGFALIAMGFLVGETVGLILGLFTGIGAFFGGYMSASPMFTGTVGAVPILAIFLALARRVAGEAGPQLNERLAKGA